MQENYAILRRCLGIFLVLLYTQSYAQIELIGTPYNTYKSTNTTFQKNFKSYDLIQIDIDDVGRRLKSKDDAVVQMSLGKSINANVVLFKNDLYASNYSVVTDGGEELDFDISQLAEHYEGYILDDPSSEVRLSLADNYIYGYIQQGKHRKYIEPARGFDQEIAKNTFIVYSPSDVITTEGNFCAHTRVAQKIKETTNSSKSAVDCGILDVAIAMDNSYVTAYTNNAGAINQSTSVMNMVEPNYNSNDFSKNLKFSIVQHYIPSGNDPWTTSSDAAVLLDAFTSWGGTGFTATHDIGQFWTNRNIYFRDPETGAINNSVAGLAWVGTICGSARYHILEDFTSTAWQLRVLTSHEMGHNFGANHDAGSGDIMAGSISLNTNSWSTQSINAINAKMNSYNCFDQCYQGSCSDITNVITSNCSLGSPSTYTLTIEINHGGGAAGSNGFNVNVDGGTYFQPWGESPQTVIIDGLISNGTSNHPITISADNGSGEGCNGATTFTEPSADCALTVEEDFNNCQKPNGWVTTTTNIISINNGDPLVQYQWKFLGSNRLFGNYSSYSNAQTTKTIDGSCMAIMDDDIFSGSIYTGTVTMETPSYDASNLESLLLEFDYLFHPFEDGGKGANNSYFRVEVWDGEKYVSILNDQDSTCPWHNVWQSDCKDNISVDVSAYISTEFKVKFTYSDAGAYAGMVAVDNFKLTGSPPAAPIFLESDCEPIIVVTGDDVSGEFSASEMVQTEGSVGVNGPTLFKAGVIELGPGFEVGGDVEFTAQNGDCTTF